MAEADAGSNGKGRSDPLGVLFIDGSCCFPHLAPLERLARQTLDRALVETGIPARVKSLPVTQAYFAGLPRAVAQELLQAFQHRGTAVLPAIVIQDQLASAGPPELERLKEALLVAAGIPTYREDGVR